VQYCSFVISVAPFRLQIRDKILIWRENSCSHVLNDRRVSLICSKIFSYGSRNVVFNSERNVHAAEAYTWALWSFGVNNNNNNNKVIYTAQIRQGRKCAYLEIIIYLFLPVFRQQHHTIIQYKSKPKKNTPQKYTHKAHLKTQR